MCDSKAAWSRADVRYGGRKVVCTCAAIMGRQRIDRRATSCLWCECMADGMASGEVVWWNERTGVAITGGVCTLDTRRWARLYR